jgi:hypothetical protein
MRLILRILVGWLCILALMSCRGLPETLATPTEPPGPTQIIVPTPAASGSSIPILKGDWRVSLIKSGGFIGMSRSLEILSSAELTLKDLRSNKTSQVRLPADKLAELSRLVQATHYQPVQVESGCADCYIYDLEISSAGEKFQVHLNQIDLANSGLQPLVDFLIGYINTSLK